LVFPTPTKIVSYSGHTVSTTSFKTQYLYITETKVKSKNVLTISCNSNIVPSKNMHFHMEATLLWSMPLDYSGITHIMQLEKVDPIYTYLKA
jgi:hypothetical protein